MSEESSKMVPGREQGDSVYDFLYVDIRRIAVFLSQFDKYGHLTSLTRTVSETSSASGGVNVAIKLDTGSSEQTSQTRQFDPQWIAPLSFLDQANARGMIVRDLRESRIGQLVLVSGRLAVFDMGVMRAAWNIKVIKDALLKQAGAAAIATEAGQLPRASSRERQRSERSQRAAAEKNMEIGLEMVKLLPHAIQCSLRVHEDEVWASLREDNLIVPVSEILIKHGHIVAGDWNMIGVLDAVPDQPMPAADSDGEQFITNMMAAISLGALWQVIGTLAPIARMALGRPASSFGMTPLLIFREVAA